jgi:hypothetical protein
MRKTKQSMFWVVYRMTLRNKATGMSAVCKQEEWEAMELAKPGYHTLVRSGITNEGEAERLARSSSVDGESDKLSSFKLPPRS